MKRTPFFLAAFFLLLYLLPFFNPFAAAAVYKYKDENGVWHFTDSPPDLPDSGSEQIIGDSDSQTAGNDLQKQLSESVPPKNKIEEARNATVSIETALSTGSGFFVSEDGYIITCKHVLTEAEQELDQTETVLDSARKDLEKVKEILDREKAWLAKEAVWLTEAEKELSDVDQQVKSGQKTLSVLEISYYNAYSAEYSTRSGEFSRRKADYDQALTIYEAKENEFKNKSANYEEMNYKRLFQNDFKIILADKTVLTVERVALGQKYDLALLKLEGYKTPSIASGNIGGLAHGQPLYAIGNPLSFDHSVTSGIFSGRRKDMIQTNTQINPGNSGGPLITEGGEVIGVNTFKIAHEKVEGMSFAIPIDAVFEEFGDYLR
jgi:hypothetical protein